MKLSVWTKVAGKALLVGVAGSMLVALTAGAAPRKSKVTADAQSFDPFNPTAKANAVLASIEDQVGAKRLPRVPYRPPVRSPFRP